jgi:hypothetical protein
MPKPIAVVFADAHLTRRTWKHRNITGDTDHAFLQIVDYACEHDLPLIGAGDLIDRRVNEPHPIITLTRFLETLREHEQPLYYIQGQHEADETPWLSLGVTTRHLHRQRLEIAGVVCYGLDFQPADRLRGELDQIPADADVLIAHQVWGDFMGSVTLPQGEFADVPHVKLLVTGDFHQTVYRTDCRNREGRPLAVFSPGATCQMNIAEPDEHYFGVLWDDLSIHPVQLNSRQKLEFHLTTEEDLERFLEDCPAELAGCQEFAAGRKLPESLRTPLWRLTYHHRLARVPERVQAVVGDQAHLFWKELPREPPPDAPTLQPGQTQALTLEDRLPECLDKTKRPKTYELASRLLNAVDPELEAEAWYQEELQQ